MPTPAPNSSDDSEQEEASPTYMPSPAPDASDDSEGEASPTYMPSMSPDVSGEDSGDAAPIAEPTPAPIMYEGYTSTPVQSDDSSNDNQQPSSADEPKTLTMAPATEGGGCDDPVEAYAQVRVGGTCCGGCSVMVSPCPSFDKEAFVRNESLSEEEAEEEQEQEEEEVIPPRSHRTISAERETILYLRHPKTLL